MAFAAWVILGVAAGWIASSVPVGGKPQMGRLLVGVLGGCAWWCRPRVARRRGVGRTFFSVGAWLVALGGATTLLLLQSLLGSRYGQRRSPSIQ